MDKLEFWHKGFRIVIKVWADGAKEFDVYTERGWNVSGGYRGRGKTTLEEVVKAAKHAADDVDRRNREELKAFILGIEFDREQSRARKANPTAV